jgi:hypothetical protein
MANLDSKYEWSKIQKFGCYKMCEVISFVTFMEITNKLKKEKPSISLCTHM